MESLATTSIQLLILEPGELDYAVRKIRFLFQSAINA